MGGVNIAYHSENPSGDLTGLIVSNGGDNRITSGLGDS